MHIEDGAMQPVQRTRDIIKSVTAMTDRRRAYLVLAIENQSNIHYAMAVKNMVYDALQYAKQVEKAIVSHKKSGDYKGAGSDEYLSGFMKTDWLMPIITLVIYFDSKKWDGPMSIHEMFREKDTSILSFIPDYRINLIAPAEIADDEFNKFRTTLKEVLTFIKYSKDADNLTNAINRDEKFHHLGRDEVNVLNACVNANLSMNENEEECDMCLALQTIAERAAKEATEKEAKEAKQRAEIDRINTLLQTVTNVMNNLGLTAEQSMDAIEVTDSDRKLLISRLPS